MTVPLRGEQSYLIENSVSQADAIEKAKHLHSDGTQGEAHSFDVTHANWGSATAEMSGQPYTPNEIQDRVLLWCIVGREGGVFPGSFHETSGEAINWFCAACTAGGEELVPWSQLQSQGFRVTLAVSPRKARAIARRQKNASSQKPVRGVQQAAN